MPALYAHNQFGNCVLQQLNEEKKEHILKHLRQFRIGLQGPDYLFFYKPFLRNPVSETGFRIHRRSAAEFMEHAKEVVLLHGTDSPEYAYMLGFICHFALDSECHPFVASEIVRTGVGHIEIESEFEKYMLRKNGEEPLSYPVGKTFPTDKATAVCVSRFYGGVNTKEALKALRSMRMYKTILVAPGKIKYTILNMGMKLSGQYEKIQGHLMKPVDNPKCRESCRGLYKRLKNAVPVAEQLIQNFDSYLDGGILSSRFDRNFE